MKLNFFKSKKLSPILICLVFGIILLFLSEYSDIRKAETSTVNLGEEYTVYLENRLSAILEKMEGVQNVSVMITLEGGVLYQEGTGGTDLGANGSIPVFLSGNAETNHSRDLSFPAVKGVSVVYQGAADPKLRYRILSLVASTLNLNENQIYVCE